MLRIFLISIIMMGTFSVADNYYTDIERVKYQDNNDILKLKLEIYQLREKNLELQKIIDNFKLTKEERQEYKHQEAILDFKRQLKSNRSNRQISLNF